MTMSETEIMLRIIHRAVSDDIVARQAGRRHYFIRGLYRCVTGLPSGIKAMETMDEMLRVEMWGAANGN